MPCLDDLYFVAGMPRSASTLMMNLLGQNPNHHVTPTSGLVNMVALPINHWNQNVWFQAEGLEKVKPRILQMIEGMVANYYHDEVAANKIIFDKNREWPFYLRNMEEVLQRPVKVILMVRDVRSVVASFEKLYRGRGIEYHYPFMNEEAWHKIHSLEGRARHLLGPGGVIGGAVDMVRDVLRTYGKADPNRVVCVSYEQFTANPAGMMKAIHDNLGLPPFDYDTNAVKQLTHENDMAAHGMDLHRVRHEIHYQPRDWSCLTKQLVDRLGEEYADINALDRLIPPKPVDVPTTVTVSGVEDGS
jgi:sulfotransferase